MDNIIKRLSTLRQQLSIHQISAYIIPGTDPHASEYIADYWKERVWISGFNGSAGTAVVSTSKAALWTDSRYFLQGAEQLEGTGFELMKQGLPETLEIIPWLISELKSGDKVGVNAQMFSANAYSSMKSDLKTAGIDLVSIDLIDEVWTDRPALPLQPFFVFDIKYTGKSASQKLSELRSEMTTNKVNVVILSALDDIAWLFNIRGKDVDYNPVTIAFAMVEEEKATLFIDIQKLTDATKQYLQSEGVSIAPYLNIYAAVSGISAQKTVMYDGAKLNQSIYEAIPTLCSKKNSMSPVFKMKSIKNATEMAGIRKAMLKDGVALTKFFMWLEQNISSLTLTEYSIAKNLYAFRSEQDGFMGESFGTIAGYGAHGAIVHYSATQESASTLKPEGILLLDSGGQYLDGTTDITRTVALGNVTERQKTDFTLVLKGHIALSKAKFPSGTRGVQLDVLARNAMWNFGINYGHGTGHGVGHFLNVHEGPQSIRMDENPTVLQAGMFMSNEPGLYRTGEYGIRIENLVHVVPAMKTDFGQFLQFETITLFPIDIELMDVNILDKEEIIWVNNYHQLVYNALSTFLSENEKTWLATKCRIIGN